MKKERAYYKNGYQKSIISKVMECRKSEKGYDIVLEDTCFYPQGGGQPSDKGTLNGKKVTDVQEKEDVIYHTVEEPFEIGSIVTGEIDWQYRFDFMQQHTAEHILSGLAYRMYGLHNVGFHMGKEETTLDLDDKLSFDKIAVLEQAVNQAILENREIKTYYPTKEALKKLEYRSKKELYDSVRIVEIPDYDICACCGIHTKTTGELSCVKIISAFSYKGGMRLHMLAGKRAWNDYHKKCKNASKISHLLSVPENEIAFSVEKLKKEKEQLQQKVNQLVGEKLQQMVYGIKENTEKIILFQTEEDKKALQHFANLLCEKVSFVALFWGKEEAYFYILRSKKWDMKKVNEKLSIEFECKGGGTKEMIQGRIKGKKDSIVKFLEKWNLDVINE